MFDILITLATLRHNAISYRSAIAGGYYIAILTIRHALPLSCGECKRHQGTMWRSIYNVERVTSCGDSMRKRDGEVNALCVASPQRDIWDVSYYHSIIIGEAQHLPMDRKN